MRRIMRVKREARARWPDGYRCGLQHIAGANGEPGVKRGSQATKGPVCLSRTRTLSQTENLQTDQGYTSLWPTV